MNLLLLSSPAPQLTSRRSHKIQPHPVTFQMKNIKLVIFDLDGTLVDAYPAIIKSFNYVMQKLGYSGHPGRSIRRAVGWGDENLLRPFIQKKDLKRGVLLYRRHHRLALIKHSRLFPGVKSLLRYLRGKGYKLAVASNRPTEFSWILIRHLGLKKYFDYVLCADKLKQGKPHPEILHKIMRKFAQGPQNTLYIGDMAIDACAGRRARVKTIMVTTGSSRRDEIKKERPWRIIPRVTGLFRVL